MKAGTCSRDLHYLAESVGSVAAGTRASGTVRIAGAPPVGYPTPGRSSHGAIQHVNGHLLLQVSGGEAQEFPRESKSVQERAEHMPTARWL